MAKLRSKFRRGSNSVERGQKQYLTELQRASKERCSKTFGTYFSIINQPLEINRRIRKHRCTIKIEPRSDQKGAALLLYPRRTEGHLEIFGTNVILSCVRNERRIFSGISHGLYGLIKQRSDDHRTLFEFIGSLSGADRSCVTQFA